MKKLYYMIKHFFARRARLKKMKKQDPFIYDQE